MKYQNWSTILLSAVLISQLSVFVASSGSSEVANASSTIITEKHPEDSPTSVQVSICLLSGEQVSLILKKPVTPRKLYSKLQKVDGYEWTNDKIYKLLNGDQELNPLSDGEITLKKDNVISLVYLILSSYPEDDITKTFINHDHRHSKFEQNSSFYSDYFIMHFAVRENGFALVYAPNDIKTPELCLAAVKQNVYSIEYVPDDLKTPEVCLAAAQQNGFSSIQYIPDHLKTPEVCLAAVQQDGYSILFIPDDLKTPKVCLAAIEGVGILIECIPNDKKTPDVCLAAIRKTGLDMLKYIPDNENTLEIWVKVFEEYGPSMKEYCRLIPDNVRSQFKELVRFY